MPGCSHFPNAKSTFSNNFIICPFGKIQLFKKCCFLKCEENVHLLNGAHRIIFLKPQRVEKSSRWIIPQLPNCPSLLLKTLNFILLINQQSFTPNQPSLYARSLIPYKILSQSFLNFPYKKKTETLTLDNTFLHHLKTLDYSHPLLCVRC